MFVCNKYCSLLVICEITRTSVYHLPEALIYRNNEYWTNNAQLVFSNKTCCSFLTTSMLRLFSAEIQQQVLCVLSLYECALFNECFIVFYNQSVVFFHYASLIIDDAELLHLCFAYSLCPSLSAIHLLIPSSASYHS